MAVRSKALLCGYLIAWIAGANPTVGGMFLCFVRCVGSKPLFKATPCTEESYRVCVCVCVCVCE